jgi:hypothetical protein
MFSLRCKYLLMVLRIVTAILVLNVANPLQAQLLEDPNEPGIWKSECWRPDKWEKEEKCAISLRINYSVYSEHSWYKLLKRAGDTSRDARADYVMTPHAPERIFITVAKDNNRLRLQVSAAGKHIAYRERLVYKKIGTVYRKMGIRVDDNDPLYTNICKNLECSFDPSYTNALLKELVSGKEISVRLYGKNSFDTTDIDVYEKQSPSREFNDAFRESFGEEELSRLKQYTQPVDGELGPYKRCSAQQANKMSDAGMSKEEITEICAE